MGTTWRWGVLLDARTADMLDEAQRLCGFPITCTQGSYSGGVSQSAGTHDGGGAVDLAGSGLNAAETDAVLLSLRKVGFAAWHRNPSQGDWPYHFHAIAGGCPDLSSGARDQWNDFLAGRNGLANNAPDDGPRDFDHVGITWEEYSNRQAAWLLEGVLLMTAHTIVFFAHRGVTYEADLLAGTYRGLASAKDYEDRLWLLDSMGIPYGQIAEGHETDNLAAFGRLVA